MSVTIWHNPRCSKSRATLALLEEQGISPTIRLYSSDPPTASELSDALTKLGLRARDLVRAGEPEFKAAGLSGDSSDVDILEAMTVYPKLIERPVVFAGGKARIGRPPEAVLDILG